MAVYIPFLTGSDACKIAAQIYGDSDFARVSLDRASTIATKLPPRTKLWLDPAAEGLDNLATRVDNPWFTFMKKFPHFQRLGDDSFWANPDKAIAREFVSALLDECLKYRPAWISVPQLPLVSDVSRNKINRILAKAAGDWKRAASFAGHLILPLIFTNQEQINGKTERNPQLRQATRCYQESGADGVWVVDKSLQDDNGSKTLRNSRFPGLVNLHEELNETVESRIRIAGPYWGMNLLLWARGLVDYPAIGVGSGYQYFLAGGHAKQPSAHLAIAPLRRRTGVVRLSPWLDTTLLKLGPQHPASSELTSLRKNIAVLSVPTNAREQVAKFYKQWFNTLAAVQPSGRSMALFQDLSAAYALGKQLPEFEDEGTARRPESVVEPLMLNCL